MELHILIKPIAFWRRGKCIRTFTRFSLFAVQPIQIRICDDEAGKCIGNGGKLVEKDPQTKKEEPKGQPAKKRSTIYSIVRKFVVGTIVFSLFLTVVGLVVLMLWTLEKKKREKNRGGVRKKMM